MRIKHLLLLILFSLLCSSCLSLALRSIGAYKKNIKLSVYTNNDKTVAYFAMKHIGPKEFYADVTRKVDSLQRQGYIVFMEGVNIPKDVTKEQQDTLRLKLRKIVGVAVSKMGYIDTINSTFMGIKFKNSHRLINQPKYYAMGVDTLTAKKTDVLVSDMVAEYEKNYGPMVLTDCDYNTPLTAQYNCDKATAKSFAGIVLDFRNTKLVNAIVTEKNKKIAVLFGALHEKGMYEQLRAIDRAWVLKTIK